MVTVFWPMSTWPQQKTVGTLVSREIAPYIEMVEGLEDELSNVEVQRFFLDKNGEPYSLGRQGNVPVPENFMAIVAVGPEALLYLYPKVSSVKLLYGMVLNPAKLLDQDSLPICGITLNITVADQLDIIERYFEVERLGILYDPQNNQDWFDEADEHASALGMDLIPLHVRKESSQLKIVGDLSQAEAILFIPDKTIISRAFIQYVIKQAYALGIPVIGYNRFFHDSGAALSFIINYKNIGRQLARQILDLSSGTDCRESRPPDFTVEVNEDAWRVLSLPLTTKEPLEEKGGI